jgi:hypothetical protein
VNPRPRQLAAPLRLNVCGRTVTGGEKDSAVSGSSYAKRRSTFLFAKGYSDLMRVTI